MTSKQRVYKVLPAEAWHAAERTGVFTGSSDDIRDGFIHLSAAHQLAGTLEKHFKAQDDLVLVAFEVGALGPLLKWEISRGGERFPHVYGDLPTALALWHRPLPARRDGILTVPEDWLTC